MKYREHDGCRVIFKIAKNQAFPFFINQIDSKNPKQEWPLRAMNASTNLKTAEVSHYKNAPI